METKELIRKYFNSWQPPINLEELGSCIAEDFSLDSGNLKFDTKNAFLEFLRINLTDWTNIELISEVYSDNIGCLLYKAYVPDQRAHVRIGEHIQVRNGLIIRIDLVMCRP